MIKISVDFINPFLAATLEVLKTMAFVDAKNEKPFIKSSLSSAGSVTGIIGMAGEKVQGTMVVSFSKECILRIVSNMLGEEFDKLDEVIVDAVGELTNMISGGAKRRLSEKGYAFEMAIPSMVTGEGIQIYHQANAKAIVIPFSIPEGKFWVEACLQKSR